MRLGIFAIRDAKAGQFMNPVLFPNQATAVRAFLQSVMTPESDFDRFAEDYSVYHLGVFESDNASFELLPQPIQIFTGFDARLAIRQRSEALLQKDGE